MPNSSTITVERNVAVPMRDGVNLSADIYRPAGDGPFPTLMQRTPYDKSMMNLGQLMLRAVERGYAVVVQDVRGRFASEGEFNTFVNERNDGYDTLEWLTQQPWCDGNVGMFSQSYVGLTQWQAAMSGHPALKAIVPTVTADNYHDGWVYQGGAFELSFNLSWVVANLAPNTIMRRKAIDPSAAEDYEQLIQANDGMTAEFNKLPLKHSELISRYAPYYDDWVDHPTYDDFWAALDVSRAHDKLTLPAMNVGGWHDIFLKGTIGNFTGRRANAPTAEARANQRLLLGPWNHSGMRSGNPIGSVNFGVHSTGADIDIDGLHLRWYDHWLRGLDNGVEDDPPVRVFVMGANRWRTAQDWPLPGTDWQEWYFHSAGSANSLNGNGELSRQSPASEPPDSYVYNPLNPTPTMGGGLCCNAVFSQGGAYDQREVERREDVLVYTSAPLEQELEVVGPLKVILYASSSAPDTDFTAKLVDVHPCGMARNLNDGIIRARYRHSMSEPELLTPGEVTEFEIDLVATGNAFQPGHRIRVEIASSNFPRFDRNPNTGEVPGRSENVVSALQTVHHSAEYPSRIILPVIPTS
ncbi:MAG TPA: CocE/NonD family hydrolase [Nitrolancea sp.]|nr:CocE/NonD family hydrolase [Nitrolancea sp.]